MKQIHTFLSVLLSASLLMGCVAEPQDSFEERHFSDDTVITKSVNLNDSYYYWYKGEKMPLTVNLDYVNVLLSDSEMDDTELAELCQEMHLLAIKDSRKEGLVKVRFIDSPNGLDEYDDKTRSIRKDPRVNGVYPFFERGGEAEAIGTSNVFYLKLQGEEGDYDPEPMQQFAEENNVIIVKEVPNMPDWYILSIDGSSFENSIEAANGFYESGLFADVDPAFMFEFRPCSVNDTYYYFQWGLNNTTYPDYDINVESAWEISTGSGVKVAVVDGGIDNTHSDLSANIYPLSFNALTGTSPSDTGDDHGTHVAGIIAAVTNNNHHVAGVAYNAKIMRVSHDIVPSSTYSAELASGISWAWQNGADVINCSWGDRCGLDYSYLHTTVLETAIINAMMEGRNGHGTIVVCAAGNYAQTSSAMNYPAIFDDRILAVGAIESTGCRAPSSSYGTQLDVVAPGTYIMSTMAGDHVGFISGTSMATAFVSGVVALVLSANPNLSRGEAVQIIEQTAKKISPGSSYTYTQYSNRSHGTWNQEVGYGLVDAAAATSLAWYSGQTPPLGSPSIDYFIPQGAVVYNDGTIVIDSFPSVSAYFSLPNSLINSSYTYYWHYTTSGDPYWSPTIVVGGNYSGIQMNIPRPNVNSVLSLSCEVYNGTTYVCTAHQDLYVLPNFPS